MFCITDLYERTDTDSRHSTSILTTLTSPPVSRTRCMVTCSITNQCVGLNMVTDVGQVFCELIGPSINELDISAQTGSTVYRKI